MLTRMINNMQVEPEQNVLHRFPPSAKIGVRFKCIADTVFIISLMCLIVSTFFFLLLCTSDEWEQFCYRLLSFEGMLSSLLGILFSLVLHALGQLLMWIAPEYLKKPKHPIPRRQPAGAKKDQK